VLGWGPLAAGRLILASVVGGIWLGRLRARRGQCIVHLTVSHTIHYTLYAAHSLELEREIIHTSCIRPCMTSSSAIRHQAFTSSMVCAMRGTLASTIDIANLAAAGPGPPEHMHTAYQHFSDQSINHC
jgi:hypothetical protein